MRFRKFVEPFGNALSTWLVFALVLIAHLTTEIVVSEDHPSVSVVLLKVFGVAVAWGVMLRMSLRREWQPNGLTVLLLIAAMIGPVFIDPLWEWFCGHGHAFEIKLVIGLRNLSLAAVLWNTPRYQKLAALLSLFTLLFCVSTSQDQSMGLLIALYLLIGLGWLSREYWTSLKLAKMSSESRRPPWFLVGTVCALLVVALTLYTIPQSTRTHMLSGFMPSSGGRGNYDRFARYGVGDGDALVAGTTEAMSFAPIEEAPFVEGKQPSLYDMFQETYGKPEIPKKSQRAVALEPEMVKKNHHRMAKAKKGSKTFTLRRKMSAQKKHRHLKDTASNAILHVVGRVPLHLRHTTYDLFDGEEWFPSEVHVNQAKLIEVTSIDDKPWMKWRMPSGDDLFSNVEPHALRTVNIDTNRIVAPANLMGVHIDEVDRSDLFKWVQPDVLAMDRDTIPNLTVIHLQSRIVQPRHMDKFARLEASNETLINTPPHGDGWRKMRQFAEKLVQDAHTPSEKIAAIENYLRDNFELDNDIEVPLDTANAINWFLFESHQGPDFMFATSAALMLRSVGVPARVVSGFYADPDKFDQKTRLTSVHESDVHWWVEVKVGLSAWHTVEPTPGYLKLAPSHTLWQRITFASQAACRAVVTYWPITLFIVFCSCLAATFRKRLHARFATWWWLARHYFRKPGHDPRPFITNTMQVIDRKLALAGTPRKRSQTLACYLRAEEQNPLMAHVSAEERLRLARWCDWALYSSHAETPDDTSNEILKESCWRVIQSARVGHKPADTTTIPTSIKR